MIEGSDKLAFAVSHMIRGAGRSSSRALPQRDPPTVDLHFSSTCFLLLFPTLITAKAEKEIAIEHKMAAYSFAELAKYVSDLELGISLLLDLFPDKEVQKRRTLLRPIIRALFGPIGSATAWARFPVLASKMTQETLGTYIRKPAQPHPFFSAAEIPGVVRQHHAVEQEELLLKGWLTESFQRTLSGKMASVMRTHLTLPEVYARYEEAAKAWERTPLSYPVFQRACRESRLHHSAAEGVDSMSCWKCLGLAQTAAELRRSADSAPTPEMATQWRLQAEQNELALAQHQELTTTLRSYYDMSIEQLKASDSAVVLFVDWTTVNELTGRQKTRVLNFTIGCHDETQSKGITWKYIDFVAPDVGEKKRYRKYDALLLAIQIVAKTLLDSQRPIQSLTIISDAACSEFRSNHALWVYSTVKRLFPDATLCIQYLPPLHGYHFSDRHFHVLKSALRKHMRTHLAFQGGRLNVDTALAVVSKIPNTTAYDMRKMGLKHVVLARPLAAGVASQFFFRITSVGHFMSWRTKDQPCTEGTIECRLED